MSFGVKTICTALIALMSLALPSLANEAAIDANKGRLGILTGHSETTLASMGDDLARALDGKQSLRVVPYLSVGSVKNFEDLIAYQNTSLAFTTRDAMISSRLRDPENPDFDDVYILGKLFGSELHLVTRADAGIASIDDLEGKLVGIGLPESGTWLTSQLLMRSSGITSTAVTLSTLEAELALLDGELDAFFVLEGKPSDFLRSISLEDGLVLAEIPFSDAFAEFYTPVTFTSDDYPNLVRDKVVSSLGVDVLLLSYGSFPPVSATYKRMETFVSELELSLPRLQRAPNNPKWSEFTFDYEIEGWKQHPAVTALLGGEVADEQASEETVLSIRDLMLQGVE